MHPTIALMLNEGIEAERRRELGRRHRAPENAAQASRTKGPMTLIDMFRAAHRGLAAANG